MTKKYTTAKAFRSALEDRVRTISQKERSDVQRLRKQIAYDRLLTRLFSREDSPWLLKGGYAMQLRLQNARGTQDLDLAMRELKLRSVDESERLGVLTELLRESAALELGDFFEYKISAPIFDLDAPPYGGARYLVEASLDKRTFEKFHLDVGIGDAWIEPTDALKPRAWLDFAGISSLSFPGISKEQHFAEKLHAYTVPRPDGRENSRVKDLVDLVLFVEETGIDTAALRNAVDLTFKRRATHPFTKTLHAPPPSWDGPFATMAKECGLGTDIKAGFNVVQKFLDSVFV